VEVWTSYKRGFYEVSNLGRVRNSKTLKILNGSITTNGYVMYHLRLESEHMLGHRLVALVYIRNTEDKPQVNHINGIKADNRVENLEWTTALENMVHSFENNLQSKKLQDIYCFTLEGAFVDKYHSSGDVSRRSDFDGDTVLRACKNSNIAYGLWWTFLARILTESQFSKPYTEKQVLRNCSINNKIAVIDMVCRHPLYLDMSIRNEYIQNMSLLE